tara:strand:- start:4801 stop:5499 length:699 start_codon:yes stop_codon:yes gene_type:complete
MIYKVYDSAEGVVFEDRLSRKRNYDLFDLSVTVVQGNFLKIIQLSTSETIFNKLLFSSIVNKAGVSVGDTAQQVKDYIDSVVLGQKTKSFNLSEYLTNTSFSGNVAHMQFPVSPYGTISNNLTSESVTIGNASDSVRGSNNSLELRNLSTNAQVKYKISLLVTVDQNATISVNSDSGQFAIDSEVANGTSQLVELQGTSSVTNQSDWTMHLSMATSGSGTYRVSSIEITITK